MHNPPHTQHLHSHTPTQLSCYCLFLKLKLVLDFFSVELVNDCCHAALTWGQSDTECAFPTSSPCWWCCIDILVIIIILIGGLKLNAMICHEIKGHNKYIDLQQTLFFIPDLLQRYSSLACAEQCTIMCITLLGPAVFFFLNQWPYHKACGMKPYKVIEVLRGEINWRTQCKVPPAFLRGWVISDKANGHIMHEAYQTILQFLTFSLRLNYCFYLKFILFMFWFAAVISNNRNHAFYLFFINKCKKNLWKWLRNYCSYCLLGYDSLSTLLLLSL